MYGGMMYNVLNGPGYAAPGMLYFGLLWVVIWTVNSILFGMLLWALIKKFHSNKK